MEKPTDDHEIKARLAAHDASALEMIWTSYSSSLLGYLVSMLCSMPEAEDVLQEVFVTIAKKRDAVAKASLLKPYLFKMARNIAMNRISASRRRQRQVDEASVWLVGEAEVEGQDDRVQQLASALESLPEEQRIVIVMKFYRDKTFREIGELLGISENTAGSRYRYGMAKLQDCMEAVSS